MLKKALKTLFLSHFVAKRLIKPVLRLHNATYMLAGIFGKISESNVHPKHKILLYKEWFLEHINENDVVLDIGCNTGSLPRALSKKAESVYGIEILEDLVNTARQYSGYNNVKYILGDATLYDYGLIESVSVITLSNVLEHIENRVEFLRKIIRQVHWKNENDKRLLIRVPMIERDWITLYKKEIGVEWRLDKSHFIEYTLEEFQEEMRMSEVDILNTEVKFGEIYAVCKA